MKMLDFDTLFELFKAGGAVDETCFHFRGESEDTERFIGYLPDAEKPYWAGLCDVEGGTAFKTAIELFTAPIYGGRSLYDRRDEIVLTGICGLSVEEYTEHIL